MIDKSIVSTDNEKIRKTAVHYGLEAPFVRSKELSGDFVAMLKS